MTNSAVQSDVPYQETHGRWGIGVGPTLRKAWWLGLGIFATVGEQTARVADALVQKGRDVEPSVVSPIKRVAGGLSNIAQKPRELGQRTSAALTTIAGAQPSEATTPTREQFEKLAEEVRTLRQRLGERGEGGGFSG